MKQYYEFLCSNDKTKISPWLGQGVYTPDFLGMLLCCTHYNEMMDISAGRWTCMQHGVKNELKEY